MTKVAMAGVVLVLMTCASAQSSPKRPKITGIDHVVFYTTDQDKNQKLYVTVLGLQKAASPIEPGQVQRFIVGKQWVGYTPEADPQSTDRMDHVALTVENCEAMRSYLASKGVAVPTAISLSRYGFKSFEVKDPEGNRIEFVERTSAFERPAVEGNPVSRRMIHAGFIVRDRAAEDRFYKDLLGFRSYWSGGMRPDRTDWVAIQVPDGTDWLEYMLNIKSDADQHTKGVMNHISLGVKDMNAAQSELESHGWQASANEHSQIGKDGKLQLNVYDPDQTRIELMEFKPVDRPCCSQFTGPHPSEGQ
jgi:catechol 2,3-dioxygenase-like lactoylglutathione lyase family enzyme